MIADAVSGSYALVNYGFAGGDVRRLLAPAFPLGTTWGGMFDALRIAVTGEREHEQLPAETGYA